MAHEHEKELATLILDAVSALTTSPISLVMTLSLAISAAIAQTARSDTNAVDAARLTGEMIAKLVPKMYGELSRNFPDRFPVETAPAAEPEVQRNV